MKVTVGRIVHYYRDVEGILAGPHAAIVTSVWDSETGCANLHVFEDPPLPVVRTSVLRSQSGAPEPGRWSWPPRDREAGGVLRELGQGS